MLSPHADDEVLGAPSVVFAARDSGWRVVNLLCFLGPGDRQRRLAEVTQATAVMGIELRLAGEPLLSVSALSEPESARALVSAEVAAAVDELSPALVLSPSPHDGHYAHEAVGDGVRDALEAGAAGSRWVMWGWWGDLPLPTTVIWLDEVVMARAQTALAEHRGELDRLDLSGALDAHARWNAAVGPERVMGPGYRPSGIAGSVYADLVLEAQWDGERWRLADPRVVAASQVLDQPVWGSRDLTSWLDAPSASNLIGRPIRPDASTSA